MLQAGSSRPWPEILEEMTGSKKLDAAAMLEYFMPLSDWLDKTLEAENIVPGWYSKVDDFFPDNDDDSGAKSIGQPTSLILAAIFVLVLRFFN